MRESTTSGDVPRRYATRTGVARYLSRSAETIKRWTKDPKKKFPQPIAIPGGRALYSLDDIDAYMHALRQ